MLTWQVCEAEVNAVLLNPARLFQPVFWNKQQKHQNNQEVISRDDYSEKKKIMIFFFPSQMVNLTRN